MVFERCYTVSERQLIMVHCFEKLVMEPMLLEQEFDRTAAAVKVNAVKDQT